MIDRIEVLEDGGIQVRRAHRIVRDGTVISTTYSRVAYTPGADLTDEDPRVRAMAAAAWSFVRTTMEK